MHLPTYIDLSTLSHSDLLSLSSSNDVVFLPKNRSSNHQYDAVPPVSAASNHRHRHRFSCVKSSSRPPGDDREWLESRMIVDFLRNHLQLRSSGVLEPSRSLIRKRGEKNSDGVNKNGVVLDVAAPDRCDDVYAGIVEPSGNSRSKRKKTSGDMNVEIANKNDVVLDLMAQARSDNMYGGEPRRNSGILEPSGSSRKKRKETSGDVSVEMVNKNAAVLDLMTPARSDEAYSDNQRQNFSILEPSGSSRKKEKETSGDVSVEMANQNDAVLDLAAPSRSDDMYDGRLRRDSSVLEPSGSSRSERERSKDNVSVEMVNKNGVVVDLAALARSDEVYASELRRRMAGMETEEELLGFMEGLEGKWCSTRKKRRVIDAGLFGDALPVGWKLVVALRRQSGRFSPYCRRYISPSGEQLRTCKEVSSYLKSHFGLNDATLQGNSITEFQPLCNVNSRNPHPDNNSESGNSKSDVSHLKESKKNPSVSDLGTYNQVHDLFECHNCNVSFNETDKYFHHLVSFHRRKKQYKLGSCVGEGVIINDGKYECQFCHKVFEERRRYLGHVGNHVKDYIRRSGESPGQVQARDLMSPGHDLVPREVSRLVQSIPVSDQCQAQDYVSPSWDQVSHGVSRMVLSSPVLDQFQALDSMSLSQDQFHDGVPRMVQSGQVLDQCQARISMSPSQDLMPHGVSSMVQFCPVLDQCKGQDCMYPSQEQVPHGVSRTVWSSPIFNQCQAEDSMSPSQYRVPHGGPRMVRSSLDLNHCGPLNAIAAVAQGSVRAMSGFNPEKEACSETECSKVDIAKWSRITVTDPETNKSSSSDPDERKSKIMGLGDRYLSKEPDPRGCMIHDTEMMDRGADKAGIVEDSRFTGADTWTRANSGSCPNELESENLCRRDRFFIEERTPAENLSGFVMRERETGYQDADKMGMTKLLYSCLGELEIEDHNAVHQSLQEEFNLHDMDEGEGEETIETSNIDELEPGNAHTDREMISGISEVQTPVHCFLNFSDVSRKVGEESCGDKFDHIGESSFDINVVPRDCTDGLTVQDSFFFPEVLIDSSNHEGRNDQQLRTTLCVWCGMEFFHEAIDGETQSDSVGFMCPSCRAKISKQFSQLECQFNLNPSS